jgi:hypothetical protein
LKIFQFFSRSPFDISFPFPDTFITPPQRPQKEGKSSDSNLQIKPNATFIHHVPKSIPHRSLCFSLGLLFFGCFYVGGCVDGGGRQVDKLLQIYNFHSQMIFNE